MTSAHKASDIDYARTLKDGVLKWCLSVPDPNKIKLSEVKDRFKTIHLMILGVVMDLLCEDKALTPNSVGRMVLYSVAPEHLTSKTLEGDISKSKPQRDKENLVPKGIHTSIKKTVSGDKKRKEISNRDDDSVSSSHVANSSHIAKKQSKITKSSTSSSTSTAINKKENKTKSNQQSTVVSSSVNMSLLTHSPGPLNRDAASSPPPCEQTVPEEDIEFVSLALYRIFDGMVDVTSLSAFKQSLTEADLTFSDEQADKCLRHLEQQNKIMIFNDDIYLI